MSDLIRKSDVLDLLYRIFDKYKMITDKNTSIGKSFGTDVFEEIRNMQIAYDVDKVVDELNQRKIKLLSYAEDYEKTGDFKHAEIYSQIASEDTISIEIVKQGIVSDDVCEWKFEETNGIAWHCDEKCTTYNQVYIKDLKITLEDFECKCPYCGKKIKVIGGGVNDD